MSERHIITFRKHGQVTVGHIEFAQVLDESNVRLFGSELIGFIEGHPGVHLLLDFARVHYMSSAVLTELIRAQKTLASIGGSMRFCGFREKIRELFEITRLDKAFIIEKDVEKGMPRYERAIKVMATEEQWERDHEK
jgi:anti-anti-sigma factor